jgi:FkbM family methyltransferase
LHDFAPFNRLKACRYGQMLFNVNDMYIGRSLDLYGEFSEGEVDVFRQIVQPGDLVLDIGANIGAHTLFFARQVGPSGRVLAFEPQRIVFQTLCGNMAINGVTNVWCQLAAVGAELGEIRVPWLDCHSVNNFGGLALGGHASGDPVPVITVDSLKLPSCKLIKLDVEGMEEQVLRGAVQTLNDLKPILYVENDRADRAAALIQFIDELGYAMYWHCPPLYNPLNHDQNAVNVFGQIVSKNMVCVHRSVNVQMNEFQAVDVPRESAD